MLHRDANGDPIFLSNRPRGYEVYSCNVVSSRGNYRDVRERNDIFVPHLRRRRRRRVKITFSHARALHHHEYLCARQVLESGIELLWHIQPVSSSDERERRARHRDPVFVVPTLMEP